MKQLKVALYLTLFNTLELSKIIILTFKIRRCILQCDSMSNYSYLKVISRGNKSKYYKNLRNAVSVSNYEMWRWVGVVLATLPNKNPHQTA